MNALGILSNRRRREKSRQMVRRQYHDRGWLGAYKRYEHLLVELMFPACTVLDVGCGRTFPMADYLKERGAEVHGIDPEASVSDGSADVVIRRGKAERIPYADETFDFVISRSVFEHLARPVKVFREFRRVLKPQGCVVFLTPNRYDYISLAARLIPNSLHGQLIKALEGREEEDTLPTYYRANCVRQIREICRRTDFQPRRLDYINHYLYLLTFSPLLCRIGIAYDKFVQARPSLRWLQAWLLGVLAKEDATESSGTGRPERKS